MAIETPYNPMKNMVTVQLPRATGKEEKVLFVALNGKGYTIKKGVPVRVPRPVYDILMESQRQQIRQAEYEDAKAAAAAKSAKDLGL